jgi:hypothetical protein
MTIEFIMLDSSLIKKIDLCNQLQIKLTIKEKLKN